MRRVFEPGAFTTALDGTDVSAFLDGTDVTQEVPFDVLDGMSISAGRIEPKVHSWVSCHPAVTRVTYLCSGTLTVRLKEPSAQEHYDLELRPGQAVVSKPGTLIQLRNDSAAVAEVLYMESPSRVFEVVGPEVRHDDAILAARTWDEVVAAKYDVPASKIDSHEAGAQRAEALRRVAKRKGVTTPPLTSEPVVSLKEPFDYLAPDGSEIRLLVRGETASMAHCVLPAGKASSPVRHRTVEELWYVLGGAGEVWRARDGEPIRRDAIRLGDSLRIPVGTAFQFRAAPSADLELLLTTMPPWPENKDEAVPAIGIFELLDNGTKE